MYTVYGQNENRYLIFENLTFFVNVRFGNNLLFLFASSYLPEICNFYQLICSAQVLEFLDNYENNTIKINYIYIYFF